MPAASNSDPAFTRGATATYQVLDYFVLGKSQRSALCEDAVVLCSDLIAVIDGDSASSSVRFSGMAPGRFARQTLERALPGMDRRASPAMQVNWLARELRRAVEATGVDFSALDPAARPSASVAYVIPSRRLLVAVGTCQAMTPSGTLGGPRLIDEMLAHARAQVVCQALASGSTASALLSMEQDPGCQYIAPLLRAARYFQNQPNSEFSFGKIDGFQVAEELIITNELTSDTVILATDGYPFLKDSLTESEACLQKAIARDPLCISILPRTEPVRVGQNSFDDRAYLKVVFS